MSVYDPDVPDIFPVDSRPAPPWAEPEDDEVSEDAAGYLDWVGRKAEKELRSRGFTGSDALDVAGQVLKAVNDGALVGGDRVSSRDWDLMHVISSVQRARIEMADALNGRRVQEALVAFASVGAAKQRADARTVEPRVIRDLAQDAGRKGGHETTYGTPEQRAEREELLVDEARDLRTKPRLRKAGALSIAREIAKTTRVRKVNGDPYAAETIRRILARPQFKDRW